MQKASLLSYLVVGLLIGVVGGYGISVAVNSSSCTIISPARCALRTAMRRLWSDHAIWTRNYVISALAQFDDLPEATARILQNQVDIGAAITTYYGADAGNKLTSLLKEHILLAAAVVQAAKANNSSELAQSNDKWYKNAQDIAKFLSDANPNWKYSDLVNMLNMHLKLLTDQVTARIQKRWKDEVAAFDAGYNEILAMADQFTDGIVAQFPKKF